MTTYQSGEIVDISIKGARVTDVTTAVGDGSVLDFDVDTDWVSLNVRPDDPAVTITRVAPPEWPPRPGDLWRGGDGELWFIHTHAGLDTLGGKTAGGSRWIDDAAGLLEINAPLTLVHREPEAGERS